VSRTKPTILLTYVNEETGSSYEITDEYAYYMVLYRGNAFNIRHWANHDIKGFPDTIGPKYPKTCFANSAHCVRLAAKLNQENNTNEFTVVQMRGDSIRVI
jgi:hypothetical protein